MPNPTGINQYSTGGAGGDQAHQQTGAGNSHPDHMSPKEHANFIRSLSKGAAKEGYSTGKTNRGDR